MNFQFGPAKSTKSMMVRRHFVGVDVVFERLKSGCRGSADARHQVPPCPCGTPRVRKVRWWDRYCKRQAPEATGVQEISPLPLFGRGPRGDHGFPPSRAAPPWPAAY